MKKIMNKKSSIVGVLLLISISFWGQDFIYKICGAWKNKHDIEIIYKRNGDTIKRNTMLGNDFAKTIFYKDGKGYVIYPNETTVKDSFTWKICDNKFIYHENDSCPWYDTLKYEFIYGTKYDTLKLENKFKRKSYRYISLYCRDKIKLTYLPTGFTTLPSKKISYFAYSKRLILDQKPVVLYGKYDDVKSILSLEYMYYSMLKEARGYDSIELFVVDNSRQNISKISSFVIEYSLDADTIKDIFLTNKYFINERL